MFLERLIKNATLFQTSNTFPSFCRVTMETAICNLETVAILQTFDCHGNMLDTGGDPVSAEVVTNKAELFRRFLEGFVKDL